MYVGIHVVKTGKPIAKFILRAPDDALQGINNATKRA